MVFDAMIGGTFTDFLIWIGFSVFLVVSFFLVCAVDQQERKKRRGW